MAADRIVEPVDAPDVLAQRGRTLQAAWALHPERFVHGTPKPAPLPEAVWINPPATSTTGETCQYIETVGVSKSLTGSGPRDHRDRQRLLKDALRNKACRVLVVGTEPGVQNKTQP